MAQQWHDAVLVLRLWVPPRPGLQRGCRRDVSLLLYSFVRSFQVVLSERGALVGGSQPLRDRSRLEVSKILEICVKPAP